MTNVAWIAVDWGTSRLRGWAMSADDQVIEARSSDDGMAGLNPADFAPVLVRLMGDFLSRERMPVVACGMLGARQGWAEADYASVPCAPPRISAATRVQDAAFDVAILPGVKQHSPADVMRGEETQIAGFLRGHGDFDGVICLPGTHTKWVHISAGEIVSFRTAMTGELFGVLKNHSILRHALGQGWDEAAFAAGLDSSLSKPEGLATQLFGLRAENLLHGLDAAAATARLSGLLIGAELASMKPYWLGQRVALIGAPALCARYAAALKTQGVPTETANGEDMTLAGLIAARTQGRIAA